MSVFVRGHTRGGRSVKAHTRSAILRTRAIGKVLGRNNRIVNALRGMVHTGRPKGRKADQRRAVAMDYTRSANLLQRKRDEGRKIFGRGQSVPLWSKTAGRIGRFSPTYR